MCTPPGGAHSPAHLSKHRSGHEVRRLRQARRPVTDPIRQGAALAPVVCRQGVAAGEGLRFRVWGKLTGRWGGGGEGDDAAA